MVSVITALAHRDDGPSAVHDDGRHDAHVVVGNVVEGRSNAMRPRTENEVLSVPVVAQSEVSWQWASKRRQGQGSGRK